ncbi:MAG: internal scaffolding protein [Microviridae sp.]|nr:MAG: internal scaffolding protein [Microviridae sp.]
MFLRSGDPFNYDTNGAGDESGLDCSVDGAGRTKQSFKEEVDINTIVRRFGLSGVLPAVVNPPMYGDFGGVFDYQTAMNAVVGARESFMSLPAGVRSRFHNDPQELLAFLGDEGNKAEAIKLGLVDDKEAARAAAEAKAAAERAARVAELREGFVAPSGAK